MLFGLPPPPVEEDPVYNQPCFSVCNVAKGRANAPCPKTDTERSKGEAAAAAAAQ
jgi:hypothetical protein